MYKSPAAGANLWLTLPSKDHHVTAKQQLALDNYGERSNWAKNNVAFPYIEDVQSIIDTKDCINHDEKLLFSGGRRYKLLLTHSVAEGRLDNFRLSGRSRGQIS